MKFATAFLTAMDRPELIPIAAQDPGPDQQRLIAELKALFASRTYAQWLEILPGIEVSWAPVLDMVEAFDHPHAAAREMVVGTGEDAVIGNPVRFLREPGRVSQGAPVLDEHGAALREKGW